MHADDNVAPKVVEYVPAGQLPQSIETAAPTVPEKVPEAHGTHVADETALNDVEYLPATQLVQAYIPKFENVPATHGLHAGPVAGRAVYEPAGHVEHALDPSTEYVPATHVLHVAARVALVAVEK